MAGSKFNLHTKMKAHCFLFLIQFILSIFHLCDFEKSIPQKFWSWLAPHFGHIPTDAKF